MTNPRVWPNGSHRQDSTTPKKHKVEPNIWWEFRTKGWFYWGRKQKAITSKWSKSFKVVFFFMNFGELKVQTQPIFAEKIVLLRYLHGANFHNKTRLLDFAGPPYLKSSVEPLTGYRVIIFRTRTLPKTITWLAMENHHVLIGGTSSNGWFSSVMLVFIGVTG